jgi:hypothetical protein
LRVTLSRLNVYGAVKITTKNFDARVPSVTIDGSAETPLSAGTHELRAESGITNYDTKAPLSGALVLALFRRGALTALAADTRSAAPNSGTASLAAAFQAYIPPGEAALYEIRAFLWDSLEGAAPLLASTE